MPLRTISNLALQKKFARQWPDSPIRYLSATWSVDGVPGLVVQRRRQEDDVNGTPSWALVSDLLIEWNHCHRELRDLVEQGRGESPWAEQVRTRIHRIDQRVAGLPLGDQAAFAFKGQRFQTREDALRALDVWLYRAGVEL